MNWLNSIICLSDNSCPSFIPDAPHVTVPTRIKRSIKMSGDECFFFFNFSLFLALMNTVSITSYWIIKTNRFYQNVLPQKPSPIWGRVTWMANKKTPFIIFNMFGNHKSCSFSYAQTWETETISTSFSVPGSRWDCGQCKNATGKPKRTRADLMDSMGGIMCCNNNESGSSPFCGKRIHKNKITNAMGGLRE